MTTTNPTAGTPIESAVALVTGGHRGFGRAVVDELLERGAAKVYATSRSEQPQRDPRVVPLILDVSDDASVDAVAQAAPDVSIVVNNAGILLGVPILTAPLSTIRDELETNLFGILRVARAFAPILAAHPASSMVNVLSVLSWMTLGTGYEISKSAAWSATNGLRLALRAQGTTRDRAACRVHGNRALRCPQDRPARGHPPDSRRDRRRRLRDPRRRHDSIAVRSRLSADVTALYAQLTPA